jgi:two-component system response regulator DesR
MQSVYSGGLAAHGVAHDAPAVFVAIEQGLSRRRVVAALAARGITIAPAGGLGHGDVDVAILERRLESAGAVELETAIDAYRPTPVLIVSPRTGTPGLRRALSAGARGLVFDSELDAALASTVRAVATGQLCVPGELSLVSSKPTLSHREREVLKLAVSGRTNSEIAAALCLAESTVKSHLSSAFSRLGVRSRREAATLVLDPEQGLAPIVLGTTVSMPGLARAGGAPATV